jgi:hypothetical protein
MGVAAPGHAQDAKAARLKLIKQGLAASQASFDAMPAALQASFSGRARLLHLSDMVDKLSKGGWQADPGTAADAWTDDVPGLPTQVNDPTGDAAFSPFAGFTQATSSTARCGNSVVVGFNDTRALLDTLFNGTGGVSFSGVAMSDDAGRSFHDLGAIPPGSDPTQLSLGQPSVACSDSKHFFYVQSFTAPQISAVNASIDESSAIALSRSSDGGRTWSQPVPVTTFQPTGSGEAFDDGRVAVDPSNPNRVYVAYRHLFSGGVDTPSGLCPFGGLETLVEVVASNDGGATFGPPQIADEQCFDNNFLFHIGVRLAVSSTGRVFTASQLFTVINIGTAFVQGISVSSFTPGTAPTTVFIDNVFQSGIDVGEIDFGFGGGELSPVYVLQGGFSLLRGFDLAVDKSGGPTDGAAYVVWHDGRNKFIEDFESILDGTYEFADVRFSSSFDGGNSFSPSAQLNSDQQPLDGRGFDHFQPTIAVDASGKVASCWYDRRNDPQNFQFERFCATSTDGGATWSEFTVPHSQSTPSRGQDLILPRVDMGQYDGLASDFLGKKAGFVDSFLWMSSGFNPDIRAHTFN